MELEQQVNELQQRVAALEEQVQGQLMKNKIPKLIDGTYEAREANKFIDSFLNNS